MVVLAVDLFVDLFVLGIWVVDLIFHCRFFCGFVYVVNICCRYVSGFICGRFVCGLVLDLFASSFGDFFVDS